MDAHGNNAPTSSAAEPAVRGSSRPGSTPPGRRRRPSMPTWSSGRPARANWTGCSSPASNRSCSPCRTPSPPSRGLESIRTPAWGTCPYLALALRPGLREHRRAVEDADPGRVAEARRAASTDRHPARPGAGVHARKLALRDELHLQLGRRRPRQDGCAQSSHGGDQGSEGPHRGLQDQRGEYDRHDNSLEPAVPRALRVGADRYAGWSVVFVHHGPL